MVKWLLMIGYLSILSADVVTKMSVGCKEEETLKAMSEEFPEKVGIDSIELNRDLMSKNCQIFTPRDKLKAVNYSAKDDSQTTVKMLDTQSNDIFYLFRKNIRIEQPGKQNIITFD